MHDYAKWYPLMAAEGDVNVTADGLLIGWPLLSALSDCA